MSLVRESTFRYAGYAPGDVKGAHYDITFTLNQLVEPANDPGWYLLNGAIASQTKAAAAFALFGSSYNTGGEGTGNFRLPDFTEGRVPVMAGLTNFPTLAATGGEINHLLALSEFPSHTHANTFAWAGVIHAHTLAGTVAQGGSHGHSTTNTNVTSDTVTRNGTGTATTSSQTPGSFTGYDSPGHSHTITIGVTAATSAVSETGSVGSMTVNAGGAVHNNMQPYIVIGGWLVKYK